MAILYVGDKVKVVKEIELPYKVQKKLGIEGEMSGHGMMGLVGEIVRFTDLYTVVNGKLPSGKLDTTGSFFNEELEKVEESDSAETVQGG